MEEYFFFISYVFIISDIGVHYMISLLLLLLCTWYRVFSLYSYILCLLYVLCSPTFTLCTLFFFYVMFILCSIRIIYVLYFHSMFSMFILCSRCFFNVFYVYSIYSMHYVYSVLSMTCIYSVLNFLCLLNLVPCFVFSMFLFTLCFLFAVFTQVLYVV